MDYPTISETTSPAAADCGTRTFEVALSPDHVIQLLVLTQIVCETCDGEIHGTDDLLPCNQVVRNGDAAQALLTLQHHLAATPPSAQSLLS